MKRKTIIISLTALIVLFTISIVLLLIIPNKDLNPVSATNLETCKILRFNGEDKYNIVLFTDESSAEKYVDYFFTTPPFNDNKENFNFYYIDDYIPQCEIYKGIAILCSDEETVKKASSCPNDYIIALKNEPSSIRSSAYKNIISLNINHPLTVMIHEFGHVFVTLSDEYVPATLPSKSKNCVKNCTDFATETDGCFLGCAKENYYRSIKNGVMKTLSTNIYGIFNQKLIEDKINEKASKITAQAIENEIDCKNREYYLIKGVYEDNQVKIINKTIEPGCVGDNGEGDFSYDIVLENNQIAKTGTANLNLIFIDSYIQETEETVGEVLENTNPFYLKIPIIKNSKTLEIKKDNKIIAQINLEDIDSTPCRK